MQEAMLPLPSSRTEDDCTSSYHIRSNAIQRAIPGKHTFHTIALLRTKLRLMSIKKVVFKNWLFITKPIQQPTNTIIGNITD